MWTVSSASHRSCASCVKRWRDAWMLGLRDRRSRHGSGCAPRVNGYERAPRETARRRTRCPALRNCGGTIERKSGWDSLAHGGARSLHAQVGSGLRQASHHAFEACEEFLPAVFGALIGLLLIRPEARLLHAQVGPRARRGESPSDDTLETIGTPRVRQRFVRLDCLDLTVNN